MKFGNPFTLNLRHAVFRLFVGVMLGLLACANASGQIKRTGVGSVVLPERQGKMAAIPINAPPVFTITNTDEINTRIGYEAPALVSAAQITIYPDPRVWAVFCAQVRSASNTRPSERSDCPQKNDLRWRHMLNSNVRSLDVDLSVRQTLRNLLERPRQRCFTIRWSHADVDVFAISFPLKIRLEQLIDTAENALTCGGY